MIFIIITFAAACVGGYIGYCNSGNDISEGVSYFIMFGIAVGILCAIAYFGTHMGY